MKKTCLLLCVVALGCSQPKPEQIDRKSQLLDSLKSAYVDKEIHLTLNNNQAGVTPLTDAYAYVDTNRSDIAFKISLSRHYTIPFEGGLTETPTPTNPKAAPSDMVLIECTDKNMTPQRGFVHYSYIKELYTVGIYEKK